jgi:hypothetical protein
MQPSREQPAKEPNAFVDEAGRGGFMPPLEFPYFVLGQKMAQTDRARGLPGCNDNPWATKPPFEGRKPPETPQFVCKCKYMKSLMDIRPLTEHHLVMNFYLTEIY